MKRVYYFLFVFFFFNTALMSNTIDCRIALERTTECNPYAKRLYKTKMVQYFDGYKKLILDKNRTYIELESLKGALQEEILPLVGHEMMESDSFDEEYGQFFEKNITKPMLHEQVYGEYKIRRGDVLGLVAHMFYMKTAELVALNGIKDKAKIKIGQKLKIPLPESMIETIVKAKYTLQENESVKEVANRFAIKEAEIVKFNKLKSVADIKVGSTFKLPLPYIVAKTKRKKLAQERKLKEVEEEKKFLSNFLRRGVGKRKLRVTATAYTSHARQTDSTPFLAAWNNRLRPGMKIIAVSRDLLKKYGMRNGTRVRIAGLRGFYRVRDKMNKRYKKRIDIYMGVDRRRALRWGRRSAVIYW